MDLLRLGCALFAMAGVTFSNFSVHAEVTSIEIAARADILGGKSFGTVGAYEKIIARSTFRSIPRISATSPSSMSRKPPVMPRDM
jgi:hypothetical protein